MASSSVFWTHHSNSTLEPQSPTHVEAHQRTVLQQEENVIEEQPTPQQQHMMLATFENNATQANNNSNDAIPTDSNMTTESSTLESSETEGDRDPMTTTDSAQLRDEVVEVIEIPVVQQPSSGSRASIVEPRAFVVEATQSNISNASATRSIVEVESVSVPLRTSTAGSSHHQSTHDSVHSGSMHDGSIQQSGSCHQSQQSVHSIHSASVRTGSIRAGSAHGSSVHGESIHAGSVHTGSIHGGSVHTGSIHGGSVHTGSIHAGSVHTGSIHAGSVHTGSIHAGSVHAGSIDAESAHTGSIHSASREMIEPRAAIETVGAVYAVQHSSSDVQRLAQSGSFVVEATHFNATEGSNASGARSFVEVDNVPQRASTAGSSIHESVGEGIHYSTSGSLHQVQSFEAVPLTVVPIQQVRSCEAVPAAPELSVVSSSVSENARVATTVATSNVESVHIENQDVSATEGAVAQVQVIETTEIAPMTTTIVETHIQPVVESTTARVLSDRSMVASAIAQPATTSLVQGQVTSEMTAQTTTTATTMNLPTSAFIHTGGVITTSGSRTPGTTTSMVSGYDTTTSYEASRRQISSIVISEEFVGQPPSTDLGVRYVDVPIYEEVVKRVPKREVVEVEKIVPKYEVEVVERIVETPRIQYVDRVVEKPTIQEVIVSKAVKQIQEIPREVIRTVPKIETRIVEQIRSVPGEVIEVAKPYQVENRVPVKRWVDKNMPVVVAQTIRPIVIESAEVIDVDVYEYEPQVIPVDVHVAKPVNQELVAVGQVEEFHQAVHVPAAQYNTILKSMNTHITDDVNASGLPYLKEGIHVPFLNSYETPGTTMPVSHAQILGYQSGVAMTSRGVSQGLITPRNITTAGELSQYHTNTGAIITTNSSVVSGVIPQINVITTAGSIHGARSAYGGSVINPATGSIHAGSTKMQIQGRGASGEQQSIEGSMMNKSVALDGASHAHRSHTHHKSHSHTHHSSFSPSTVQKKKRTCGC